MFDRELLARETRVAETWAAWRDAVKALEEYRRLGAPPVPEFQRRDKVPPAGWPRTGTVCKYTKCAKPLTYPRQFKHVCSESCKAGAFEEHIMSSKTFPRRLSDARRHPTAVGS